jgi:hypothetical protein
MMSVAAARWHEANLNYLLARLQTIRARLEREPVAPSPAFELEGVPALDHLCASFNLSAFECDVLLLAAGMEIDPDFGPLCARINGADSLAVPTFSLSMAILDNPHWSAFAPVSPLRRWRLIELGRGESLAMRPVKIDERVLDYLMGVSYLDERLQALVETVSAPTEMRPSQSGCVAAIRALWSSAGEPEFLPLVHLRGESPREERSVAARACADSGMRLFALRVAELPSTAAERENLARIWERDSVLGGYALLLECGLAEDPSTARAAYNFAAKLQGVVFYTGPEPRDGATRPVTRIDIPSRPAAEESEAWKRALGARFDSLNGAVDSVVSHFHLDERAIETAAREAAANDGPSADPFNVRLWDACRVQARAPMGDLGQLIHSQATWDDLVLPEPQMQTLRDMASHVRRRSLVYTKWGMGERTNRGLALTALFAGPSGTGKTLAAEVLAAELRLDLYRIDLSQVVNKYIGETEKNLRAIFRAAEASGAILLFDEADALFGKRSEVKDSHDRYSNIEVSWLLQCMETYRNGLAILTTNLKSAIDSAFLRRIRFIVPFPFPDASLRREIWQRAFPTRTPVEGIQFDKLARLNVSGGNIRNISLHAAFLAADSGEPVRMAHLLRAARNECAKLEKPLSEAEVAGWV